MDPEALAKEILGFPVRLKAKRDFAFSTVSIYLTVGVYPDAKLPVFQADETFIPIKTERDLLNCANLVCSRLGPEQCFELIKFGIPDGCYLLDENLPRGVHDKISAQWCPPRFAGKNVEFYLNNVDAKVTRWVISDTDVNSVVVGDGFEVIKY